MSEEEFEIFTRFAEDISLPIIISSIEKCLPPEPDILCEIKSKGKLAFELTEYVPQEYMERAVWEYTRESLEEYRQNLDRDEKAKFDDIFSNGLIHLRFINIPTLRERKQVFPRIFKVLNQQDPNFTGALTLSLSLHEQDNSLVQIFIDRGNFDGPVFETDNCSWLNDPLINRLEYKFQAENKTEHPIELIIHTYNFHFPPFDILKSKVSNYLKHNSAVSGIRKVWFYDFHERKIIYEKKINKL